MNPIVQEGTGYEYLGLAPEVFRRVQPAVSWVYRNVYRERITDREGVDIAKTALFEAHASNATMPDEALIAEAVRIYRGYLWAPGTPAYENMRMASTGKSRSRLYADKVVKFPWGAEVHEPSCAPQTQEAELPSVASVFDILEQHLGPEIALIYVLHHGYGWSLARITKYVLGADPTVDCTLFMREHKRLTRLIKHLGAHIKGIYASRKDAGLSDRNKSIG